MDKTEYLNIPSKFAHSRFVDSNGEKIKIKGVDIDCFYSLVYLYRLELLQSNPNCLSTDVIEVDDNNKSSKKKKKSVIEENINFNGELSFEFNQIMSMIYGGKHNSKYSEIRKFIDVFKDICVETNLFDKDKTEASKIIRVFDVLDLGSDNVSMNVTFTKEYILPYIVTEKYFKKVRLDILHRFSSSYTKKMYLFFKDYSNCEKKTNRKNISTFLGEGYNKNKIESYIYAINQTDINVKFCKIRHPKKSEIKFIVKGQQYFTEGEKYEYELEQFIMEDCKKITQQKIDSGGIVENFYLYAKSILKNKLGNECEMLRYESMYKIRLCIKKAKEMVTETLGKDIHPSILLFVDKKENGCLEKFIIDDNYKLLSFPHQNIIESDPIVTYDRIKYLTYFDINYREKKSETLTLITF